MFPNDLLFIYFHFFFYFWVVATWLYAIILSHCGRCLLGLALGVVCGPSGFKGINGSSEASPISLRLLFMGPNEILHS